MPNGPVVNQQAIPAIVNGPPRVNSQNGLNQRNGRFSAVCDLPDADTDECLASVKETQKFQDNLKYVTLEKQPKINLELYNAPRK